MLCNPGNRGASHAVQAAVAAGLFFIRSRSEKAYLCAVRLAVMAQGAQSDMKSMGYIT